MPTQYRVQGKHIYRASVVPTRMGTKPDGSPDMVDQPGPMTRVEVGTVLDDVTDQELRAFPDRFAAVEASEEGKDVPGDTTVATMAARGAAHEGELGPLPPGTTPEQAAAARAAAMRPETATAAEQGSAALAPTGQTSEPQAPSSQAATRQPARQPTRQTPASPPAVSPPPPEPSGAGHLTSGRTPPVPPAPGHTPDKTP